VYVWLYAGTYPVVHTHLLLLADLEVFMVVYSCMYMYARVHVHVLFVCMNARGRGRQPKKWMDNV